MRHKQTCRQTDRRTSKLNIPHYHGGDSKYSPLFTENGRNNSYSKTYKQVETAGLNKLNYTIIYTMHDMKIS